MRRLGGGDRALPEALDGSIRRSMARDSMAREACQSWLRQSWLRQG
jgi:hypothetical protein